MTRLVQKFGGSSVCDIDHIRKAAEIACQAASEGHQVSTVVSAMGRTTDELIRLAHSLTPDPSARELDMLVTTGEQVSVALMSMAIQSLGKKAKSFTGAQAGIVTEANHGSAKIKEIRPSAIESSLSAGEIAVVAGFQGITEKNELTTLGRGGSDTTAVALATALSASRCDVYTDVQGVYTADPRYVEAAQKLDTISYEEMHELSLAGAKVMNARSVETAKHAHMPVRVRSTFVPDDTGTLITHQYLSGPYDICGIACDISQDCFRLVFDRVDPEQIPWQGTSQLFKLFDQLGISTDGVTVLTREAEHTQEIYFTAEKRSRTRVQEAISALGAKGTKPQVHVDSDLAKVSIVGRGLASKPAAISSVFDCLTEAQIAVSMVTSAELAVSLLVPYQQAPDAVRLLHSKLM